MKIYIPASSSSDSSYLLYKTLTETDYKIITRIRRRASSTEDITKYKGVCDWLKTNVRDFDCGFMEYEMEPTHITTTDPNPDYSLPKFTRWYHDVCFANKHNVDFIYRGENTFNFNKANWFFQTSEKVEEYYSRNHDLIGSTPNYTHTDHNNFNSTYSQLGKITDIPFAWPFMNRTTQPMGRLQIFESLPEELKSLISYGCNRCGVCTKCLCLKWYHSEKQKGVSAETLDDLIMKHGRYGKYWDKDAKTDNRYAGVRTDWFAAYKNVV